MFNLISEYEKNYCIDAYVCVADMRRRTVGASYAQHCHEEGVGEVLEHQE